MYALTHALSEWMEATAEQISVLIMIIGLIHKKDYQGVRRTRVLRVIQAANAGTTHEMSDFYFSFWLLTSLY